MNVASPLQQFMPHGMCFLWDARLVLLHAVSDALIAAAYFSIPIILVFFIRRRREPAFTPLVIMFGTFIAACGTTHVLDIWTIWHPAYWLSGTLKAITAGASLVTAGLLVRVVPQALAYRSPAQLTALNERLESSERRFRALTDCMPQMVGILDANASLRYVNREWFVYTGSAPAGTTDYAAMRGSGLVHPDDITTADGIIADIKTSADVRAELRLRRADGAYRWHAVRVVPLDAEHAGQWIFACTDVEDQYVSRAALEVAAQRDRAIAARIAEKNRLMAMAEKLAHLGHWRLDKKTDELYWSDEIYRTFGFPATYTPSVASAIEVYHPDDRANVLAIVGAALTTGRPYTHESRIVHRDGSIRYVVSSGQAELDPDGSVAAIFGVFQDITSLKEAVFERERLTERVTIATQASRVGIWEWDLTTNAVTWDAIMFGLYGCADGAFSPTYERWVDAVLVDDREAAILALSRAARDHAPFDTEFRVRWPDGEIHHLRAMATVVPGSDGRPHRMIGTNWDITELRMLAEQLQHEKERLIETVDLWTAAKIAADEASRAKSDFLARMSHEIRTPMNGIIGFATLVLEGNLDAEQQRHMTYLRDAGTSLMAIINDILDFSKIEAGKLEIETIALQPREVVESSLAIIRREAHVKGLAVDVEIAADVPTWVIGDPTRIRQILLNLLTNALKFTDRGAISVRVRRDDSGDCDGIYFEVTDSGIGIPLERRHTLFADFSQVASSTSRQYGGTGLGLAISQRLAQAMNGAIGMKSAAQGGSTFWFTARLPATGPPKAVTRELAQHTARRILVVDDNAVNCMVVEALLRKDGHDVCIVSDGSAAIAMVQARTFDLVLMDMQMPVMDGVDATRAIRKLAAPFCDVPIVALTANALNDEVERCRDAGMNDHLSKPIDREHLRTAIAKWTRSPAGAGAAVPLFG